jgi:hypothetical protein
LQPTASPSSTNLASTGSTLSTTPLGVQPASPATITNAPLATYPTTGAPPASDVPPLNVASTRPATAGTVPSRTATPNASGLTAAQQTAALASVPAAGPYDPNAYRPSASLAASQPSGTTPATDRYGSYASAAPLASDPPASTPISTSAAVDRYALPAATTSSAPGPAASADRYATAPSVSTGVVNSQAGTAAMDPYGPLPGSAPISPNTTGLASSAAPAEPAATTEPANLSSVPPNAIAAETAAAAQAPVAATATVQIQSPAGQYRPGGTSSYTSTAGGNRVDVASRPGAPATSTPSVPASTTPASDPWTPQPAPPTSTPPVRHGGSVSVGGTVY